MRWCLWGRELAGSPVCPRSQALGAPMAPASPPRLSLAPDCIRPHPRPRAGLHAGNAAPPAGYCSGWGDPHYVTFDGLYYSYQGNCTYVLVEEITPTVDNFGVYIDNYHCDVRDQVSCPRTLIVRHETQEVLVKTVNMAPMKVQVRLQGPAPPRGAWAPAKALEPGRGGSAGRADPSCSLEASRPHVRAGSGRVSTSFRRTGCRP